MHQLPELQNTNSFLCYYEANTKQDNHAQLVDLRTLKKVNFK